VMLTPIQSASPLTPSSPEAERNLWRSTSVKVTIKRCRAVQ
jgi:hypothetical protein